MEHTKQKISTSQINAYLDERLNASDRKIFESDLSECEKSRKVFAQRKAHHEFILDLIPTPKLSRKAESLLLREIEDINLSILDTEPDTLIKKAYKFLTKPVIEF